MNKSAIAIYGPSSQGKSATVSEVATQLMAAFPNHTLQVINTGADVTYISETNGVKIGIESQGDPNSRMLQSLQTFVAQACDITICYCRSRGATVDAVKDLNYHHPYEIIWTINHRSWHKTKRNSIK